MTASELKETKANKGRWPANEIDISQIRTIYILARSVNVVNVRIYDLPIKFFPTYNFRKFANKSPYK
jgi:hypothetical protein